MKRALLACVFGIATFWYLAFSLEAFEKKEDESEVHGGGDSGKLLFS
ncbi:MAG: hypothetical protein HRF42_10425 [Candidatus Brocadia sp.]|jgi:hypothetical protein